MPAYGYGPPPPPPPQAAASQPSHGRPNASYQGRGGGGSNHRGTSGGRGRGGHHNNHRGDYRGAPAQPNYEYAAQAYPQHATGSYGGVHPPSSYPPAQPHWSPDHAHAPPPHPHAHGSVPIASSGYHPSYPSQPYPPTQYPTAAPPYGPPPQYAHTYQPLPHQNTTHWDGQGPTHNASYGAGRHRGSYGDRGGAKGSSARHGYEHQASPPVANGAYGSPYTPDAASHHLPPPYTYPGPPPPPGPAHQDSYYVQQPRRGRGGSHRDGNVRGRGGHHTGDRSRQHKHGNHNHGTNNNANNHQKNDKQEKQNKHEPPSAAKKKKRKVNTLGLTPAMDSDTEDDEGEEKVLSEMIGQESLAVKDIAAFLAERRKNFPTKARVDARKAAELAQSKETETELLEKQAKQLRRQLAKVEVSIKRKREQGDEGDEMREVSPTDSSDDEKPEVMSSRPQGPQPPAQPDKKADISRHCKYYSTGGTCGKKGKCRFVHDPEVREAAIKEREANNGRLTIQQRLILNDKEQEDLTVLQSIQYLRAKGLMPAAPAPEAKDEEPVQIKTDESPVSKPKSALTTSLLPAASPSLPPLPVKREGGTHRRNQPPPSIIPSANSINTQGVKHYQGWLLKPYGSSNGKQSKSDDLP
ncbi:hypothetical protein HJFPF1_03651 [Paramyrothecium foliicola]|nr:hypothetical protein HJFPF1_03651 [Paramyrothecium foliicola]